MHAAVLLDRWEPRRGGAEAALDALVRRMVALGHRVSVFGLRADPAAPGEFHPVRARGWTRGRRESALSAALSRAAREHGCDAVLGIRHVTDVDVLWLHGGSHRASVTAKREAARGEPLEGVALRGRHRAMQRLEDAALAGGARLVVVPSQRTASELGGSGGESSSRVEVEPNGVDLARFHPSAHEEASRALRRRAGLDPAVPLLVLPARNPRLKGAESLARALGRIAERRLACVVAGPRDARAWRRRLARLAGPLHAVVVLAEADPVELAAGADLAVHPTWRDPCSLATLEAAAAGTPVVTTERNGALENVRDTEVVRRVRDPSRIAELAAAIASSLDALGPARASLAARHEVRRRAAVPASDVVLDRIIARLEEAAASRVS